MKSCMDAYAHRVGDALDVDIERISMPVVSSVKNVAEPILSAVSKVSEMMAADAGRVDNGIEVSCSLICVVSSEFYLRIAPQVVWLTEDNRWTSTFEVESNVKWIIE